jgi:hypothetical protein
MDDDDDEGYEGEDGDYGTSEGGDEGVVGHHQGHSMPPRYMGSGGRHLTPQQQHIMDMEELGAPSSSQPSGTAVGDQTSDKRQAACLCFSVVCCPHHWRLFPS